MKTQINVINRIVARVRARNGGVVSVTDLLEAGPRPAIDKALSRLVQQGKILRVRRGLYAWPRVNPLLGRQISQPSDELVQAWAKKNGLKVIPSGALAANILELSTQVPAKMIYYTNGRTKTLKLGANTVRLLNRGPKTMDVRGRMSSLIFQALKYLGKNGMTPRIILRFSRRLSSKDKKELERNLIHASAWMKPILFGIIGKKES